MPTEVVGTAHQIHRALHHTRFVGDGPTAPHQHSQALPERAVEPLDVGGVDVLSPAHPSEGCRYRRRTAMCHPPGHLADASLRIPLDHLPDQQPVCQAQAGPPNLAGVNRVAEDPQEGGDVAGQPVDADQDSQARGASAHSFHQRGDQHQVTVRADESAQPQPRRHGYRHRHPQLAAGQLHPKLVGLHVAQIHPPLLYNGPMHRLAVFPGSLLPVGDGALIEAEGSHDRLDGAAVTEQRHHEHDHIGACLQAVEGRTLGGSKGLATQLADVAPLLRAVNANVALADLPSCGTVGIVAEFLLWVRGGPALQVIANSQGENAIRTHPFQVVPKTGALWASIPSPGMPFMPLFIRQSTPTTVQWGATATRVQAIEEYDVAFREMRTEAVNALRREMLREFWGTACYQKVRALVQWGTAQTNADAHRAIVKRAMRQGKAVPEPVLADYPELLAMARCGQRPMRWTAYPWEPDRRQWEEFAVEAPASINEKETAIADLERAKARCRTPNGRTRDYERQIEKLRRQVEHLQADLVMCQDCLRACREEDVRDGCGASDLPQAE